MSRLDLSASFEYISYWSTAITHIVILSVRRSSLYVCRRQILTYIDNPRADRVKNERHA